MTVQLDIFEGRKLRDQGIQRAKDKAEKDSPGWNELVWLHFKGWLSYKPVDFEFMMEDFSNHIKENNPFLKPEKGQAFGFITKRALKEKLIEYCGVSRTKSPVSHRRPANVWIKI